MKLIFIANRIEGGAISITLWKFNNTIKTGTAAINKFKTFEPLPSTNTGEKSSTIVLPKKPKMDSENIVPMTVIITNKIIFFGNISFAETKIATIATNSADI